MSILRPMEAVAAMYTPGQEEVTREIFSSISNTVFGAPSLQPASTVRKVLARLSYRIMKLTTKSHKPAQTDGTERVTYSNRLLDRSGHPYAQMLMGNATKDRSLVEGGDPMNSQYMMLCPKIRANGQKWDRLLLDSLQGKDVRMRLLWETLTTYELAKARLDAGHSVRMKAVAAGTGLSFILVYDRLVRDGYEPSRITAIITDRDPSGIAKSNILMDKLETTKNRSILQPDAGHIVARPEDIFDHQEAQGVEPFDIITAIGVLEYFHGHTYTTTEHHYGEEVSPDPFSALDLVKALHDSLSNGGSLVVNTYRRNSATMLLEIFGRRFDYRDRKDLAALMSAVDLELRSHVGSGHIYDVEVYGKKS